MRTLGAICSMIIAVVLFTICIGAVAIRALGMGTLIVTGASMEPTIAKGALAIVEPVSAAAVRRGDIVTFERHGQLTTHRVVAVDASGPVRAFVTKGDANTAADPEPVQFPAQVGLYRASIPVLGYVIAYTQAYWRLVVMIIAAAVFLGSGATLVFTNARPVRRTSRRPAYAAVTVDADELWADHIGWLRERTARQVRAA